MVFWPTDKTRNVATATLDRELDKSKQLVSHVLAHQQTADLFAPSTPQLALKALNYRSRHQ
jgi:hypothetical protein